MALYTAKELAQMLGGRCVGDAQAAVEDVSSLETAGPQDLAFARETRGRTDPSRCRAAVLVTSAEVDGFAGTQIVCEDAGAAMAAVLDDLAERRFPRPEGVSPNAAISPSATVGSDVAIGHHAVVEDGAVLGDGVVVYPQVYVGRDVRLGERTVVHANASIHDRVTIGADCIIHYNAVIGSEGFGFIQRDGRNVKLAQVGTVRIGDRVEVGALTTIDRATLDATVIEDGVKIDNHCHVAHNCHIGPDCILAGYTKLAGSVRLGRGVICAENVGVNDHVTVGDGAILGASAGVPSDVEAGAVMLGTPARPIGEQRRIFAIIRRLPDMWKRLRQLEKQLEDLGGGSGQAP
jgi:UDP-3-O-[3-hydroxymyristoyl] glucosamine N-acyltransferase